MTGAGAGHGVRRRSRRRTPPPRPEEASVKRGILVIALVVRTAPRGRGLPQGRRPDLGRDRRADGRDRDRRHRRRDHVGPDVDRGAHRRGEHFAAPGVPGARGEPRRRRRAGLARPRRTGPSARRSRPRRAKPGRRWWRSRPTTRRRTPPSAASC